MRSALRATSEASASKNAHSDRTNNHKTILVTVVIFSIDYMSNYDNMNFEGPNTEIRRLS